ncbi:hypothetical protein HBB16_11760 [Pseudonocardia sp. MCCB 268]|nr:hypothetical protein [Pseudonocardia cytotoxica]
MGRIDERLSHPPGATTTNWDARSATRLPGQLVLPGSAWSTSPSASVTRTTLGRRTRPPRRERRDRVHREPRRREERPLPDPDGNELEVPRTTRRKRSRASTTLRGGMEKLDFALDKPSLMDSIVKAQQEMAFAATG